MDSARPFRAFVSYCHADKVFAARLQRKLESYRLPRRLADRVTPFPGQAPGRIGPVFRDREDLSAATDLSAAVREAIAASSTLVVVASPDAAMSQWVEREIGLFRQLHPQSLVLVALARGEPAEALPEALRTGAEPLCADFRKHGDGRRLAFLKIVAGLAEVPLDALVQRDAQRQVRRVTALTAGAAVLVLIMAALLTMAIRARQEAERQRVGAEGVIEAMLTDVRKQVRRTGHLKLRAAINHLALTYYSQQGDLNELPDESVERRARVLHALGEDDAAAGNYSAARSKFDEAYKATSRIMARKPGDPNAIFAHAQSEYWLGSVAFNTDDPTTALRHWRAYLARAQALSRIEPHRPRSLLEAGYAHGNLCEVNVRDQRNWEVGLTHCRKALELERAALALKPGDEEILRALANRHGWTADTLLMRNRYDEARTHRNAEAAIMASLLKTNSNDAELQDRALWPQIGLAKIDIAQGRLDRGLGLFRECLRRLDRLGADFPDNQLVLGERIRVNVLVAATLHRAGRGKSRAYRDRAEELLYGRLNLPKAMRQSRAGLERQAEMFASLEQEMEND